MRIKKQPSENASRPSLPNGFQCLLQKGGLSIGHNHLNSQKIQKTANLSLLEVQI
jgi:hypothetical protein